jgi:hypothetical protein
MDILTADKTQTNRFPNRPPAGALYRRFRMSSNLVSIIGPATGKAKGLFARAAARSVFIERGPRRGGTKFW